MRKKLLRSRSGFEKPESREEAIMQNILGASNVLEPSESNIEEILKSILYNTPYTKEAEFEIEKILLAIKNNGTYDGEGESRDMKILIAILNDLDYTEEAESRIEELFIEWLQQRSQIKVLEGVPPLTFTARGLPLINYLIEGNTVQDGTPTPSSPVDVVGVGTLDSGQYKIPISSGGVTTNIYLGSTQTVRAIKKLVLTGDEDWEYQATYLRSVITINNIFVSGLRTTPFFCTHYIPISDGRPIADVPLNAAYLAESWTNTATLNIKTDAYTTAADFKAYLAAQYANGTPVTVWYILATPQTAAINEPLMKIVTYADTLSKEQAGVEIPTVNGSNTLDVDTTVKPSNIYIEYK